MTKLQRTKRNNWKIASGIIWKKDRQFSIQSIYSCKQSDTNLIYCRLQNFEYAIVKQSKKQDIVERIKKQKKKKKRKKHGRVYIGHSLRHNLYNRHKLRFSYRSQAPYPSLFLFLSPRHVSWRQNNFPSKADKASPGEFLHFKITRLANCRGRYTVTWFISSLTLYFTSWSLLFRANTFR